MRIPKKALLLAVQRGIDPAEAFSTTLYTGNGGTQTITNGIDLAGEGGLVWMKCRSLGNSDLRHILIDTFRGHSESLSSDTTNSEVYIPSGITGFNSDGFGVGSSVAVNYNNENFASWTFRKAPKFFDIVQYTGDGTGGRQIAHDLGVAPGMIVVKRTDAVEDWFVYHRKSSPTHPHNRYLKLNTTDAVTALSFVWGSSSPGPTESHFVADLANTSGGSYIAYLFAHDPNDSGIIQCGSYTGTGSSGNSINLGWKPQWVLIKRSDAAQDWEITDEARTVDAGWTWDASSGAQRYLSPNLSSSEDQSDRFNPFSTGFEPESSLNTSGATYIYMAIRAPE